MSSCELYSENHRALKINSLCNSHGLHVTAEICELTVSDDELASKSGGNQMSHI